MDLSTSDDSEKKVGKMAGDFKLFLHIFIYTYIP